METRNERLNVGVYYSRSRNGAPSRKECVVDSQMTTKASDKSVCPTPPTMQPPSFLRDSRVYLLSAAMMLSGRRGNSRFFPGAQGALCCVF